MINIVNNKGYTLLEALLGIIIMTVLITLSMYFLTILNTNMTNNYNVREMVVFLSQVQLDLLESRSFEIVDGEVILENYIGQEIKYLKDKNRLVRKVQESGYEIMLTKVKEVEFLEENKLLEIKIVFENEYKYEGYIGAVG